MPAPFSFLPRAPMLAADHAWLRMERPDNRVIIHLALVVDGPLQLSAVMACLSDRLLNYPAFTHKVVRCGWRSQWQADPQFRLEHHVRQCVVPGGLQRSALKAWMASQAHEALPADRPLWDATLVHNVDGEHSALVMRVHHALADGVSLMHLMRELTDVAPGTPRLAPARTAQRSPLSPATLRHQPWRVLADAWRLATLPADRPTLLKGQPGIHKSVAWSESLPLAQVHALAKTQGTTVNDVMLALIADVLRQDLRLRTKPRPSAPIRTVVPMNLRRHGEEDQLGNRFGLVGCDLPVHLSDPLDRLRAIHRDMQQLKHSWQGQLALALVQVAGCLPQRLQDALLGLWSRRCTVIVTNVIGPAEPRTFAGAPLDDLMLLVPQGMTVGVGVSIVSYAGQLRVGFLVDTKLMPDCSGAAAGIKPAFDRLRYAVRRAPTDLRVWRQSRLKEAGKRQLKKASPKEQRQA
ncbi:MAG: hypothetical protein CFE46_15480 [Burkholderiales bacterium PBB6]|nr:MAG: hypothetical protein CFE46_15480 [Burkholderiales bacterium PBB6]